MALNPHLSIAGRNGMADTLNTALGSNPRLRVYNGTQPANADAALSGNTVLADIALTTNPFSAASSGACALAASASDTSADASGTATWASFTTSGGTRVLDGSCATATADFIIDNATIVAGQTVSINSYTFTLTA